MSISFDVFAISLTICLLVRMVIVLVSRKYTDNCASFYTITPKYFYLFDCQADYFYFQFLFGL